MMMIILIITYNPSIEKTSLSSDFNLPNILLICSHITKQRLNHILFRRILHKQYHRGYNHVRVPTYYLPMYFRYKKKSPFKTLLKIFSHHMKTYY